MSERPEEVHHGGPEGPERVQAGVRHGWWPGWIWAIPIAALLVVIWLGARALLAGGTSITIRFTDAHGMKSQNTDILMRGTHVGHVTGIELTDDGTAVLVTASIDDEAAKFLRTGTRFWLRGAHPSLGNLSALGSLLSGPSIVMSPGPGRKARHFIGLQSRPIAPAAGERPILYAISVANDAGSLSGGDPVTLRGFIVGEVRDVGFVYDPATGAQVTAEIERLIDRGMRARLTRSPPLVGRYEVKLQMLPGGAPPAAPLKTLDGMGQIPVSSGNGITSIVNRINKIPIERITRNVLKITQHVNALTSSPKLRDAIAQLDAALRQIHGVTARAGPQIGPLIARLRRAANDLDGTAQSANRLMSGTAAQNGLTHTAREITEAARAVRSLANYLDRHPAALLRGRTGVAQ
jgi:paraquat-inducible protein B